MSIRSLFPTMILSIACLAGCSGATGGDAGDAGSTAADDTGPGETTTPTTGGTTAGGTTTGGTTTGGTTTGATQSTGVGDLCGNGEVDGDEVCDGAALGGKQCADVDAAFVGGALACADDCASFDASGCEIDPNVALVAVNEVTSKGAVTGPYADQGDAIELYNAGGAAADLGGWRLSDDPRLPVDKTYVFPPGTTLAPGAFLVLVAFDDVTMLGQLPFGVSDDKQETLTLVDAQGGTADEVMFSGVDAVVSYCRLPDGTGPWQTCAQSFGAANVAAMVVCGDGVIGEGEDCDGEALAGQTCEGLGLGFTGGTLGCAATCSFDAAMCVSDSAVALNELESTDDQIELYNAGNQVIDLSGWILTDDLVDQDYDPAADLEKLVFAPQTTLAAKQFLVVAKGKGVGEHIFGLGAGGDTVTLLMPNLEVVDQVTYAADEAAQSYCRLPDGPGGAWTVGCEPTFGAANAGP